MIGTWLSKTQSSLASSIPSTSTSAARDRKDYLEEVWKDCIVNAIKEDVRDGNVVLTDRAPEYKPLNRLIPALAIINSKLGPGSQRWWLNELQGTAVRITIRDGVDPPFVLDHYSQKPMTLVHEVLSDDGVSFLPTTYDLSINGPEEGNMRSLLC